MKHVYPLATLLLATLILSSGAFAQTYSGGTYTAYRTGNWHVNSGPNVWTTSEPPSHCINCQIIINSGVSVTLNTSVTLSNSSILVIGTDPSSAAALIISPASGGTDWASAFNIILQKDGSNPGNAIQLANSSAFINVEATGAPASYDGIITSVPDHNTYFKQVGSAPSGFTGTDIDNGAVPPNGSKLFGSAYLGGNGILPILLVDFTAVMNEKKAVDLAWATLTESNADYFGILRSTDGGAHWETIGKVAAKGASSTPVNYSFTDANPPTGVSEYRLQLFDRDAQYKYSDIKVIRSVLVHNIRIFPNPARDYVYVTLGGNEGAAATNFSIRVLNQAGQVLAEKKVANGLGTTQSFTVSNYPPGNYVVVVNGSDGSQQATKIVISKQ
ncbi:T9SS type A sorting domain-containing protein [Flavitalea flava]